MFEAWEREWQEAALKPCDGRVAVVAAVAIVAVVAVLPCARGEVWYGSRSPALYPIQICVRREVSLISETERERSRRGHLLLPPLLALLFLSPTLATFYSWVSWYVVDVDARSECLALGSVCCVLFTWESWFAPLNHLGVLFHLTV
jgi:hypothetical protein